MSFARFFIVSFLCLFSVTALGQPNTVQLKDGAGTLISSHQSITAAYNAIPAVITNAYVIEILPDYNTLEELFPIQIGAKSGSSIDNTITLRPAAGNYGEVISRALNNNPIINLNGVNYFILDGRPGGIGDSADLLIENSLNVGAKTNTINFIDGASNNTVRYVIAKSVPRSNAGPRNLYFSSSNLGNTSNNLVEFCKISGGRAGVSFNGISSGINSGNTIRNSKIYEFGLTGFWLVSAAENTTIQGCEIYQQETGLNTSFVGGILLNPSGARGTTEIINNKIYNLKHNSALDSAACWGIMGSGSSGSTLNIINNFIALPEDNQNTNATHGIYLNDSTEVTCNIYYNTVLIGGIQSGSISELEVLSSGITKTNNNSASVFNIVNNIFINNRLGGTGYHVGGYIQNTGGALNVDYNCYFSDQAAYQVVWGTVLFDSLYLYRNTVFPNEQNSIFKNVEFASNIDLHLTGNSIGDMDLAGMPCSYTFDIDNDIRDPFFPYKGADESDALPVEMGVFTASVSDNDVNLTWTTITEYNNAGFELERKELNGSWTKAAFINGAGTSTIENSYSFTDADLASGTYSYRLKQIDFGGAYTYYNLSGEVIISAPAEYVLAQNYPNPFNPSTKIEFTIPQNGIVSITIFNVTGEAVKTLVNSEYLAGKYQISFDASDLSSGTYFYTIRVNDFTSTKKMMLLR